MSNTYMLLNISNMLLNISRFKELADKKKEITNMDIESIVNDEAQDLTSNRFKLVHIQVNCAYECAHLQNLIFKIKLFFDVMPMHAFYCNFTLCTVFMCAFSACFQACLRIK